MKNFSRQLLQFAVTLLAGVSLNSCGPRYDSRLLEIEGLMKSNPDSASYMLAEFENHENPSRLTIPNRNLYELLRADARYYADSKDSLNLELKAATRFFEDKNDFRRASRANFLMGDICVTAEKNLESIGYLLSSAEYAKTISDTLSIALADRGIAESYGNMNDWGNAISYYEKSMKLFQAAGDTKYYPWEYYALSEGCIYIGEYDKARKYAEDFCRIGHLYNRPDILRHSYGLFIKIAGESHNPEIVFQYLDSVRCLTQNEPSISEIEYEGLAALETDREMLASKCLDTVEASGLGSGMLEMQWNIYHDRYKEAFENLEDMLKYQNETIYRYIRRDYSTVLNTHYEEKITKNKLLYQKEKQSTLLALFISIALIVGLTITIIFYRRRLHSIRIDKKVALDQFKTDIDRFSKNESKILDDLKEKVLRLSELEKRNEELDRSVKATGTRCANNYWYRADG